MCDYQGCDEPAEYYDDYDNKVCSYCIEREIDEGSDIGCFELISVVDAAIKNGE